MVAAAQARSLVNRSRTRESGALLNGLWIVAALGVVAVIVALISAWQRRSGQRTDLGTVSHQWIMENRMGPGQDSRH